MLFRFLLPCAKSAKVGGVGPRFNFTLSRTLTNSDFIKRKIDNFHNIAIMKVWLCLNAPNKRKSKITFATLPTMFFFSQDWNWSFYTRDFHEKIWNEDKRLEQKFGLISGQKRKEFEDKIFHLYKMSVSKTFFSCIF